VLKEEEKQEYKELKKRIDDLRGCL